MDAQFWIYIVIGIIYFISRMLKKPEASQPPRPRRTRETADDAAPAEPEPTPVSFEDLLREIMEGKQVQKPRPREVPQPTREPVPMPMYEAYEQDPGEEARSLEEIDAEEESVAQRWKPYEEIPAGNVERISLEETLRLEDTVVDFKRFEAFERRDERRVSHEYMKILRNPQTLKQAVVMSEILKRKF